MYAVSLKVFVRRENQHDSSDVDNNRQMKLQSKRESCAAHEQEELRAANDLTI